MAKKGGLQWGLQITDYKKNLKGARAQENLKEINEAAKITEISFKRG